MPEAICCCLQTSTYCFFVKVVRYICRETFVSKTSILFELYEHMYCYYNVLTEAIFVVYLIFFPGDLPAMNICLRAKFQVWWSYGFGSTALQQD